METKAEQFFYLYFVLMSGFNGTSFDDNIGKGHKLMPNFGIFCPVELNVAFLSFLEIATCSLDGGTCKFFALCQQH
jgi:hypothetical protein